MRELACHKRHKKEEKDRRRRSFVPAMKIKEINREEFQSQEEDNGKEG